MTTGDGQVGDHLSQGDLRHYRKTFRITDLREDESAHHGRVADCADNKVAELGWDNIRIDVKQYSTSHTKRPTGPPFAKLVAVLRNSPVGIQNKLLRCSYDESFTCSNDTANTV